MLTDPCVANPAELCRIQGIARTVVVSAQRRRRAGCDEMPVEHGKRNWGRPALSTAVHVAAMLDAQHDDLASVFADSVEDAVGATAS